MALLVEGKETGWTTLRVELRVINALMLRDVRTRFFGVAAGFLIAVAWPLANILILLGINALANRTVPFGESAPLWFATGLVPFTAFNYMSRYTMLGLVLNKPLLGYPIVKPMDVLLARGVLEVLNAGLVASIMMLLYALLDIPFFPADPLQALAALGASMLLGLGFGLINGVIAAMFPFWVTGYALFAIIMWIASGVMIVPDSLPEVARYWLSYNPALQGVEWMRSAYYEGYGSGVLDKTYMLIFALCAVIGGFVLERTTRGQILK